MPILSLCLALFNLSSSWQPLFQEDNLEIKYKMESCESSDYIFFSITNHSDAEIQANFELLVKGEDGQTLFTFHHWNFDLSPGTVSNECGNINDNQLAVLLPQRYDNASVHLIQKP